MSVLLGVMSMVVVRADDAARLTALLAPAVARGGVVTIPAGDHYLDVTQPLPLPSHATISAYGARFHLPKTLGDKARVVLFAGENVRDFRWFGGHFVGSVFDPAQKESAWEPNVNTRAILITTTPGGRTENLLFRDISSEGLAGATITGNIVDGTNGSRVISVEKSCEDVTITGNTFRNGGRGSWINQPKNFVMTGNVFVNNTTKSERDPRRGRRTFLTGDYEQKPELYFTLHQRDGRYGPVIVRDNIFVLGPACPSPAVTFAPGGEELDFSGNIFRGQSAVIRVDPSCEAVRMEGNRGAEVRREPVDFNHGRR